MIYLYLIHLVHTILWKTAHEVNNKGNINDSIGIVIKYVQNLTKYLIYLFVQYYSYAKSF